MCESAQRTDRNLLDLSGLDNYLRPLVRRLAEHHRGNSGLVSAWCTKQHGGMPFVRIAPTLAAAGPSAGVLVATTNPPAAEYKIQIRNAVADAADLPPGQVVWSWPTS